MARFLITNIPSQKYTVHALKSYQIVGKASPEDKCGSVSASAVKKKDGEMDEMARTKCTAEPPQKRVEWVFAWYSLN